MHPTALEKGGFTATLNMALSSTAPERSAESVQRRQLARFGKWLYRLGFVPGTAGNLSVRLSHDRILATPTGMSKCLLKAADMVVVDMEGRRMSGSRNVTSEIGMHLAIYHQRPDVSAVVHAHPPIPLAPYATTGTADVGSSIQPLIVKHDAVLLANHGVVTAGDTLQTAFMRMETVEHFAHISLVARQLGCAQPLSHERLQQLAEARSRYERNSA
jgi:L-fuculose-phosphate aldolase